MKNIDNDTINEWIVIGLNNSSKNTIKNYSLDINNFMKEHDTIDVFSIMNYLNSFNYSEATYNRKLASFKSFINYLNNHGGYSIKINDFKTKKVDNTMNSIEKKDLDYLLDILNKPNALITNSNKSCLKRKLTVNEERNRAIVILLLSTGMRNSELCNLLISDISNDYIAIKKSKGNKSRQIPISPLTKRTLEQWLSVRPNYDNDNLFNSAKGGKVKPNILQNIMKKLNIKLSNHNGKKINFTPHTLRHYFATTLSDNNVNVFTLQKLMGHSNIENTKRYVDVSKEKKQEAVNIFA